MMWHSKRGNRYFDRSSELGPNDDDDRSDDYRPNNPPPAHDNDWRLQESPRPPVHPQGPGLRGDRPSDQAAPSRPRSGGYKRDVSQNIPSQSSHYRLDRRGGQHVEDDENEDDDWGFVRKGRQFVRKGRIAKRVKVNEVDVHTNLFCNTCRLTFRNVNEKLAHEMSRDHITQSERGSAFFPDTAYTTNQSRGRSSNDYYTTGSESIDGDGLDLDHTADTPYSRLSISMPGPLPSSGPLQPVNAVAVRNEVDDLIKEGTKFIGSAISEIPPSFLAWAERSLSAFEAKVLLEEVDPADRLFVNREVLYTLSREIRNSTLFRADWRHAELATGDIMKPKLAMERSYTLEEIEDMEATYEEAQLQEELAGVIHTNPFPELQGDKANSLRLSSLGSGIASRDISKTSLELTTGGIVQSSESPLRTRKPLNKRRPLDRLGKRCRELYAYGSGIPEGMVLRWHSIRSALPDSDSNNGGRAIITSLVSRVANAESKVHSGSYNASSILSDLEDVIAALSDADSRLDVVMVALELCIRLAIDERDYSKVAQYTDRLAKMYVHHGFKERSSTSVALWLLCLTYNRSSEICGEPISFLKLPIFLVSRLRQLPRKSLQSFTVSEALAALTALCTNHWVDFLRYFKDSGAHAESGNYTNEACAALVRTVYQRASLTMFRQGKDGKCPYDCPGQLSLGKVAEMLVCSSEDDDEVMSIRKTLEEMVDPPVIRGGPSDGANAWVVCEDSEGHIGEVDEINLRLLLNLNGDAFRVKQVKDARAT